MKSLLQLSILTAVVLFCILACRKNLVNEELTKDQKLADPNVAAVKKWYYETFNKSAEWRGYNSASGRTSGKPAGKKEPVWKYGIYNKLGNLEINEFPLSRATTFLSLPAALSDEEKIKIAAASLTRIAFIKNEKNEITVREIIYIPELRYLQKKNFDISQAMYGKPGDDFTGRIFIKNWNEDILSVKMINNGKLLKRGSIKKTGLQANGLYRLDPEKENCEPKQYCVWRQDCTEWYSGDQFLYEECGNWYNTGDCWREYYCDDGGGDSGNNNDCNSSSGGVTARVDGSNSETTSETTTVGECPCEFYNTCNECNMSAEEGQQALNGIIGNELGTISFVFGNETTDGSGIIRQSVTALIPVFSLQFSTGLWIRYTGSATGIRYKAYRNDSWKWETFDISSQTTRDNTYPVCFGDNVSVTISSAVFSNDSKIATMDVTYSITVKVICAAGWELKTFQGSHPAIVDANSY